VPPRCTSAAPRTASPAAHPIRGDELRALRELQRQTGGGYVFETERGTPFTTDAVNRLIKRIGERAGFPFKVHVHMEVRSHGTAGDDGAREWDFDQ
jgi:cytosine/adenosine deaminase-related metal-dependent hydrolase